MHVTERLPVDDDLRRQAALTAWQPAARTDVAVAARAVTILRRKRRFWQSGLWPPGEVCLRLYE
jgi:hypothetical protein